MQGNAVPASSLAWGGAKIATNRPTLVRIISVSNGALLARSRRKKVNRRDPKLPELDTLVRNCDSVEISATILPWIWICFRGESILVEGESNVGEA
jgi:hypothetical protein